MELTYIQKQDIAINFIADEVDDYCQVCDYADKCSIDNAIDCAKEYLRNELLRDIERAVVGNLERRRGIPWDV